MTEDTVVHVFYTKNAHTITINYVDENGRSVASPYTQEAASGDSYSISSPGIAGLVTGTASVDGTMPDRDVQVTVIYRSANQDAVPAANSAAQQTEETETVINDYSTPLGLGGTSLTAGVCIE